MRAKDEAGFQEFVAGRWAALVRTATLLTGDAGLAEDLVQTALVKMYGSWGRVSAARDVDAYVMRVLLNTNKDRFRRRRVAEHLTTAVPDVGAPDGVAQLAERSALLGALAALPKGQRTVLVLRFWEDYSEQQVAAVLGVSVGTVKSQTAKGLAKLRGDAGLAALLREADSPEGVHR